MQQYIDFPMEISVIKLPSLVNLMKTPLFKIAYLNDQNTFTFLGVTCLDYNFVQSDLVGSGFIKA